MTDRRPHPDDEAPARLGADGSQSGAQQWTRTMALDESPPIAEPTQGLTVGELVGPLRVDGFLGRGGMGQVYSAVDERLHRRVALKLLRPSNSGSQAARERFLAEARALSALDHPGICRIYDVVETGSGDALVLELIEGEPLSVRPEEPLAIDEVIAIGEQVADALGFAHANGLVHRDLKPSNLMRSSDGSVKILDFGLVQRRRRSAAVGRLEGEARPAEDELEEPEFTGSAEGAAGAAVSLLAAADDAEGDAGGEISGTPLYMSPEQAKGRRVGAATDVYSLGLVLAELATGQGMRVRHASSIAVLGEALRGEPQRSPVELRADLRRLIDDCLQTDPASRPTAAEVRSRLERARTRGRRRAIWAAAALALLAVVGGVSKYAVDLRRERDAAELARDEATEAYSLLETIFLVADPTVPRDEVTQEFTVRNLLDAGMAALDGELRDAQPRVEARLAMVVGKVYDSVGELDRAEELLRRALERMGEVRDPETEAEIAVNLADLLRGRSRFDEAEQLYLRAVELSSQWDISLQSLTAIHNNLALLYTDSGRLENARGSYEQALAVAEQMSAEQGRHTLEGMLLANSSKLDLERGDYARAVEGLERSLGVLRPELGERHANIGVITANLGRAAAGLGDFERAEEAYATADSILTERLGAGHPNLAILGLHRARLTLQKDGPAAARGEVVSAAELLEAVFGPENLHLGLAFVTLAEVEQSLGNDRAAQVALLRAEQILELQDGAPRPELQRVRELLGELD